MDDELPCLQQTTHVPPAAASVRAQSARAWCMHMHATNRGLQLPGTAELCIVQLQQGVAGTPVLLPVAFPALQHDAVTADVVHMSQVVHKPTCASVQMARAVSMST